MTWDLCMKSQSPQRVLSNLILQKKTNDDFVVKFISIFNCHQLLTLLKQPKTYKEDSSFQTRTPV